MPDVERKQVRSGVREVKGTAAHILRALIAHTEPIIDQVGDIVRRGATKRQPATLGSYNHSGFDGVLPPGKGEVWEEPPHIYFDGEFFDTSSGREHRATLIGLGSLAEFSVEYRVTKTGPLTAAERAAGAERAIVSWDILGVAPVLSGAMPNTRILDIKCAGCRDRAGWDETSHRQVIARERSRYERARANALALAEPHGALALAIAEQSVRHLTRGRVQVPPLVKFFDAKADDPAGFWDPELPNAIFLKRGLSAEEIVFVVAHESTHFVHGRGEGAADYWARHVLATYRETRSIA
jgi:hypothetical protein